MVRGFRLAAALAAVALLGLAQEQPQAPEPPREHEPDQDAKKKCTCKITAAFGKVVVTANGTVKIDVQVTGSVTSQPRSEETFQPKLKLEAYLLFKTAAGWQRAAAISTLTLDLFDEARACGAGDKFDKTFSGGEIPVARAPEPPNAVQCEYHMRLSSDTCEMTPVRGYARFVFTKGGGGKDKDGKPKPQNPRATVMDYNLKKDKSGAIVAYVSAVSENGWGTGAMWYP
jgi:hypothetical protein